LDNVRSVAIVFSGSSDRYIQGSQERSGVSQVETARRRMLQRFLRQIAGYQFPRLNGKHPFTDQSIPGHRLESAKFYQRILQKIEGLTCLITFAPVRPSHTIASNADENCTRGVLAYKLP
jgi:hypothetical protein